LWQAGIKKADWPVTRVYILNHMNDMLASGRRSALDNVLPAN
jgi:hypothetical protein